MLSEHLSDRRQITEETTVTQVTEPGTSAGADQPGGDGSRSRAHYDAEAAQQRWQRYWEQHQTFAARDDGSAPRCYVLDMFPYPSGDLHMGHAEAYAMGDVVARFRRFQGYDVLHPIGWDSFGLPAENAAIDRGEHPATWTHANIDTQAQSFKRFGLSLDWTRRLHTSDPEYYRWTQWLFLQFRERGLAYRKASWVNWCPHDQTVLANEQVINGHCERCGTQVTKRQLTQWFFKVTEYADRLLDDMEQLTEGWPARVLTMQRNWIGRSTGAYIDFTLTSDESATGAPVAGDRVVSVFTTRPDTVYGATFLAVAPDSQLAADIVTDEHRSAFESYLEDTKSRTEIERQSTEREKTGVFTGAYAINPVNSERLPVYAADYVLAEYGTGIVMSVPAHDQRDLEFAQAFGLPVRVVVDTGAGDPADTGQATTADGAYVNSPVLEGLSGVETGNAKIISVLQDQRAGREAVSYRLRDWLLSRQRFWGVPIPIIHCPRCGEVPVPQDQLPVELPYLTGADLNPRGTSPLAAATDWVNVSCPVCGGPAQRDTDTMDTFVDSSWYFFRYCSPGNTQMPFDPADVERWMPVDQYVGGVEHAILHLLYMRFFTKVLYDMGKVGFTEPMRRLLNQGQVINSGKAMSKSLGNGVDLGEQIERFGVDAVRLTLVFASPPEEDIDWADVSPAGSLRFLQRAYRVAADVSSDPDVGFEGGDRALRQTTHRLIADINDCLEGQRFNVAVARVMELVNAARKTIDTGAGSSDPAVREAAEAIAKALSLFAPYVGEEMWALLGHRPSVADSGWPRVDPALLVTESVTCVVQIKGKVRARLQVEPTITEDGLRQRALADETVQHVLDGQEIDKIIVRAPKLVSIVPA
jgi:leucyl-tRNA synthetase